MKLVLPVLSISFLMDGIVSSLISPHSFLLPLFSIVSLVLCYPYFRGKKGKYLRYCFIYGLFYDFGYTDTFLLNAVLFSGVGIFILFLNYWFTNNLINHLLMGFLTIIFYRLISYIFYLIIVISPFSWKDLWESIYLSLVSNLLYLLLFYLLTDRIGKRLHIEKQI